MRRLTWVAAVIGCGAMLLGVATARAQPAAETSSARPNVLFIALDDLNHWVGYLKRNPQTITPNIDRLAARGVRFSRSYCAAPACNPSRIALMSGLLPATTGAYLNPDDWRSRVSIEQTMPNVFRRAGYSVKGAGKIYHGGFTRLEEWDDYLANEGRTPGTLAAGVTSRGVGGIGFAPLDCDDSEMPDYRIVSYGIEELQKPQDKPFFLAVGLHKPHMPWEVPQKYYDMHPLDEIVLPPYREDDLSDVPAAGQRMAGASRDHAAILESGRWKDAVQGYLAAISFADAQIGRLLDALDASPYRDNTIIVLWGDHGWHLGEKHHWRKFALWEEASRAPLIWVVPGLTPADALCERTVDFMSIYPTLCELTGIEKPSHLEGQSIKSLLADPTAAWDVPARTTYGFQNHAVRSEQYRYIRYADGSEELYDERNDPFEWTNLAGDPAHDAVKAELAKWLPRTNAPELPQSADGEGGRATRKAPATPRKAQAKKAGG